MLHYHIKKVLFPSKIKKYGELVCEIYTYNNSVLSLNPFRI